MNDKNIVMVNDDKMPSATAVEILLSRRLTNRMRKNCIASRCSAIPSLAPIRKSGDEYEYMVRRQKKNPVDNLVAWLEGRNAKQLLAYARRRSAEAIVAFKRSARGGKNQLRWLNLGQELKSAANAALRELTARRNMVTNETAGN